MTIVDIIIGVVGVLLMVGCGYKWGYYIGIAKGKELAAIEWDKLVQQAIKHSEDTEINYKKLILLYERSIKDRKEFSDKVEQYTTFLSAIEREYKEGNEPPLTC